MVSLTRSLSRLASRTTTLSSPTDTRVSPTASRVGNKRGRDGVTVPPAALASTGAPTLAPAAAPPTGAPPTATAPPGATHPPAGTATAAPGTTHPPAGTDDLDPAGPPLPRTGFCFAVPSDSDDDCNGSVIDQQSLISTGTGRPQAPRAPPRVPRAEVAATFVVTVTAFRLAKTLRSSLADSLSFPKVNVSIPRNPGPGDMGTLTVLCVTPEVMNLGVRDINVALGSQTTLQRVPRVVLAFPARLLGAEPLMAVRPVKHPKGVGTASPQWERDSWAVKLAEELGLAPHECAPAVHFQWLPDYPRGSPWLGVFDPSVIIETHRARKSLELEIAIAPNAGLGMVAIGPFHPGAPLQGPQILKNFDRGLRLITAGGIPPRIGDPEVRVVQGTSGQVGQLWYTVPTWHTGWSARSHWFIPADGRGRLMARITVGSWGEPIGAVKPLTIAEAQLIAEREAEAEARQATIYRARQEGILGSQESGERFLDEDAEMDTASHGSGVSAGVAGMACGPGATTAFATSPLGAAALSPSRPPGGVSYAFPTPVSSPPAFTPFPPSGPLAHGTHPPPPGRR